MVMKSRVFKSPYKRKSIFLAGSIEMGVAEDWQTKISKDLEDFEVDIYNPRRDEWDSSWEQSIYNTMFKEQVEWELDHLDKSDFIILYFDSETKSPISLLELGLYANTGKMVVLCPDGFWRKGNVDIVCERFSIPRVKDYNELLTYIKNKLYGK